MCLGVEKYIYLIEGKKTAEDAKSLCDFKKKRLGKYIEKATEDHYWHTNPQHGSLNRKLWGLRKCSAELSVIRLACFHPPPQAFGISHVLQKGMRRVGPAHSPWRYCNTRSKHRWDGASSEF